MTKVNLRRLTWGLTGLAWFLWLGIEDRSLIFVLILAVMVCVTVIFGLPFNKWEWLPTGSPELIGPGLIGIMGGAAIPLLATILMFLKVSLHSHGQPDFSVDQVSSMLRVIPVWSLAGVLIGLAWGLIKS